MNLKEIREIINLMNEHDLTEIEVEREGTKIKIKKASIETIDQEIRRPPEYRVETHGPATSDDNKFQTVDSHMKEIKSPMVGTFYRAASPDSPPFVEVGQVVEIGQVVCIVEAMKLMNEIKSDFKGKVVEAAVENAQPVEFGQKLFVIAPL